MLPDLPKDKIARLRHQASMAKGYQHAVESRRAAVQGEIDLLAEEEHVLDLVVTALRQLIDREVNDGVETVEKLQTEGLQAVFDDMDLTVKSKVDLQRGKVSVDLLTVQKQPDGSITEASSMEAFGGSVTTVQSVLMRIIVILRRDMRPLLLLDESLAAVAEDYVPAVAKFLALLCERLGIDILAVTHNPVLVEHAHKAYRIQKVGGTASFRELR